MSSGIGFSELLILFLIGLIVLGPERLPRVASQFGSLLGKARRMTRIMKQQLEDELGDVEKQIKLDLPPDKPPRDDDNYSPEHDESPEVTATAADASQPSTNPDALDVDTEKPREHG